MNQTLEDMKKLAKMIAKYDGSLAILTNNKTLLPIDTKELATHNLRLIEVIEKQEQRWLAHGCMDDTKYCFVCNQHRELEQILRGEGK